MLNLHEKIVIIFFIFVFVTYVWAGFSSVNNTEEDEDGFYDRRDRK